MEKYIIFLLVICCITIYGLILKVRKLNKELNSEIESHIITQHKLNILINYLQEIY